MGKFTLNLQAPAIHDVEVEIEAESLDWED